MKIIKPSIDLKTWCFNTACEHCKSAIGIEAKDIRYNWTKDGCYYYTCVLCNHRTYMKSADVPPIVEADVLKSRKDKSYSSDDW